MKSLEEEEDDEEGDDFEESIEKTLKNALLSKFLGGSGEISLPSTKSPSQPPQIDISNIPPETIEEFKNLMLGGGKNVS